MINVFILTFCRNLDQFYGTELIFKTLRVGFPNAKITVVDNASLPEVRSAVAALARENECIFQARSNPGIQHHEFIQNTIRSRAVDGKAEGPLVFLDPDVCLWDCCEDFAFDGVIAGKIFGRFWDYITETVTMPRIHTSFLWIADPKALWHEVWRVKAKRFDFEPFCSFSFKMDGVWYRYDTGASLLSAVPGVISPFTEEHFYRYDHIYAGSHLDWIQPLYDKECREMLARIHGYAKEGNILALKGIWKEQEEIFAWSFGGKIPDKKEE